MPPLRLLSVYLGLAAGGFGAAAPASSTAPRFRPQTIDDAISIGYGLAVADVDGDGRDDVVLADAGQIVWYRNPDWEKHVIAEKLTERDHVCLAARDIDGDGRAELAVGAGWNPSDTNNSGAVFILQPQQGITKRWAARPLPHDPTTHRMRWLRDLDGQPYLAVLPLHGKGNVQNQGAGVRFVGYRPPRDQGGAWDTFELNTSLHATHNFDARDGGDLLVASHEGVYRLQERTDGWHSQQLTRTAAGEVRMGRRADGSRFFVTIEPMHGHQLVWYSWDNDNSTADDSRRVLDESLVQGHALATGDLLGSGSDQIVVGWRGNTSGPATRVGLRLYDSTPTPAGDWPLLATIDDNTMACEDLLLADLNADGRLDIIASGRSTRNVVIYWNEAP